MSRHVEHEDEDEWVLREVRVPKGTHLSDSKETPGAERTLLREDGSNKLLGPPEARPVEDADLVSAYPYTPYSPSEPEDEGLTPGQKELADALTEIITEVAREVVLPLVRDVLAPALRVKINDLALRIKTKSIEVYEKARSGKQIQALTPEGEAGSSEVGTQDPHRIAMSVDDFREYFLRAMAAEQFAAQLKQLLLTVRVQDAELSPELQRAIQLALEGNIAALDEDMLVAVVEFLGGTRSTNGQYVLPRLGQAHGQSLPKGSTPKP